jgi:hypothetical protein
MKRVRYLAGAAALSPIAVGLVAPVAAPAAQAATTAREGTQARIVGKRIATPDGISCTSRKRFNITPAGDIHGGGYWAIYTQAEFNSTNICVGTVDASLKFTKGTASNPFCKDGWVSAHRAGLFGDGGYVKPAHAEMCGSAGEIVVHGFGVYNSWSASSTFAHVRVVVFSTYNTTGAGINLSPP